MTLIIKETKIQNVSKNKFEELKITFLIKKEDYSKDLEDKIYQLSRDGNLGALVFEDIGYGDQENRNKLLSDLDFFTRKYIEKVGGDYETEKQVIYKTYGVKSRRDLTNDQLKYEIEKFKSGLKFE